jgi:hypothetical protein
MSDKELIEFLLYLRIWHDRKTGSSTRPDEAEFHIRTAKKIGESLTAVRRLVDQASAGRGDAIQLVPHDLEGLPEELKRELAISEAEQFDLDVLKVIEQAGGKISLDVLLVRWYREKGEVVKRRTMTNRIYRLLNKKRLYSTPGRKGVYQLAKPSEITAQQENGDDSRPAEV